MSAKKVTPRAANELLRDLREALNLSQTDVARRGAISRIVVVAVELGDNKMSSFATRSGVAKGLGMLIEEFKELFDGKVSVADMAARVRMREPTIGPLAKHAGGARSARGRRALPRRRTAINPS